MTVYKVTGSRGYMGHAPGEEFEAELSPEQEARAKQRGAIRVVKRDDDKPKQKEDGGA